MKLGLVLLVALFLSGCGRKATYADGCGRPPAQWITPRDGRSIFALLNQITIAADGTIRVNGSTTTAIALREDLKQINSLNPQPVTQITFDPALDCDTVLKLRKAISDEVNCEFGHCAEGSGEWWIHGDVGPPFGSFPEHLLHTRENSSE